MPILIRPSFFTLILTAYTRLARSSFVWMVLGVNSALGANTGHQDDHVVARVGFELADGFHEVVPDEPGILP